jgi:hypothetical protein
MEVLVGVCLTCRIDVYQAERAGRGFPLGTVTG